MSRKPKVLIIFAGGTIAMKNDPVTGGAVPALTGQETLAFDPWLDKFATIETHEYGQLPGPHITPRHMWELHLLVRQAVARRDITGVVITHGTDTLEETAFFLDLQHNSPKPVVVVGAMRTSSVLSFDGPANLRAAVKTAIAPESRGRGVLVVLNQRIHAASYATKSDTQALDTFQSPLFGPLGMVEADGVLYARRLERRAVLNAPRFAEPVDLVMAYTGADSRLLDYALRGGTRGIVIEGTGTGNVPPTMLPGIQRALDAGLPVVLSSRCAQGRVLDTYAYSGSGHDLRRRGVLFAGLLNGQKARILLMLALGKAKGSAALKKLIEADTY